MFNLISCNSSLLSIPPILPYTHPPSTAPSTSSSHTGFLPVCYICAPPLMAFALALPLPECSTSIFHPLFLLCSDIISMRPALMTLFKIAS